MSTPERPQIENATPADDGILVLGDRKNQRRDEIVTLPNGEMGSVSKLSGKPKKDVLAGGARPRPRPMDEDGKSKAYTGPVHPPAKRARPQTRHWGVVLGFVLMVIVPTVVSGWYLYTRSTDRYASIAAFSIRTEDASSAFELLGGMVDIGSSSSSDIDILYDFIQSQELVRLIDARADLRTIWAKADPAVDPVFAYHPPGTIEDMLDYWNRMVSVYNDSTTGLMEIEVQAFTPADAQMVAGLIYEESSALINRLSDIAREDATRYARLELEEAVERLKTAREAITLFRNRNQIVDPRADMQSQMGILSSLQAELAVTMIDLDILSQTTADSDPRILQAQRRIEVIEARIAEERAKFGLGSGSESNPTSQAFADIVGEYERLIVDQEFAEQTYAAARAAFDAALSQSRRQSRYLAAHIQPTLAEQSEHPEREVLLGLVALFAFLIWVLMVLVGYALKDRR